MRTRYLAEIDVEVGLDMMGVDFWATVSVGIICWKDRTPIHSQTISPPDDLEYEITDIVLQRDEGGLGPKWQIDDGDAQFDLIADLPRVREACDEAAHSADAEHYWEVRQRHPRRRAF
jgi:hypothetical protein